MHTTRLRAKFHLDRFTMSPTRGEKAKFYRTFNFKILVAPSVQRVDHAGETSKSSPE